MAANMWKNSLKNVESYKILYETLLDFFFTAKQYLLSEQASYIKLYGHINIPEWVVLKTQGYISTQVQDDKYTHEI
jgi:hypothetical protein